jgi:HPt (histidine-containing phosphotransfer) domain-containing protein
MSSYPALQIHEPSVLDTSRLHVALGGDRDIISEILELYESSARSDLDGLWTALLNEQADGVVHRSHALKGSSGNVGAEMVMERAAEIERAARTGRLEWILEQMPDLEAAFAIAAAGCRSYRRG